MKAFIIGETDEGKKKLKVVPYTCNHLELCSSPSGMDLVKRNREPEYPLKYPVLKIYDEFLTIPCGKCIGCRIDHSREWANRMMLEARYHESSYFVTLTYDDMSLYRDTKRTYVDPAGNSHTSFSLSKRSVQLFMKRLRRKFPDQEIRYFACGEYGSKTRRPHYHLILFGLSLPDLKLYKVNFDGSRLYNSDILAKIWPYGFSVVAEVNWQTCAYVSRYVTKKLTGDASLFYKTFNIEPEFSLMSRKPGLGRPYYDEFKDKIYDEYVIRIPSGDKVIKSKPPGYFDSLYDLEEPSRMKEIKDSLRLQADNQLSMKMSQTSQKILDELLVEELVFTRKVNSLKRGDCIE